MEEMNPRADHYPLPNEDEETVYGFADWLEETGLEIEDSTVAFVGGTFYAGIFEAEYPDADVIAVEQSPWSAYCQAYAANELESGTEPEDVLRNLFLYQGDLESNERPLGPTHSEELYQNIIESHMEFAEQSESFETEFVENNLALEPGKGADWIPIEDLHSFDDPGHPASKYSSREDLVDSLGQSFMWSDRGVSNTITEKIRDGFLRKIGRPPEGEYKDTARAIMEIGLDRQMIDREKVEELHEHMNSRAALGMKATLDKWQEEAAENRLMSEGNYIYSASDGNGDRRVFGPVTHTNLMNKQILRTDKVTEPSNVIVSDVRDTDLDVDAVHANNVFDYLDDSGQERALDSLSSGGEFMFAHSCPSLPEEWESVDGEVRNLGQAQVSREI